MSLPYFFHEIAAVTGQTIILGEESSRHIVQVLRMKEGEELILADGKGTLGRSVITNAHKKHVSVNVSEHSFFPAREHEVVIAVSPVKNNARLEWLFEKITEIGVTRIIPIICERTEKERFRFDRMNNILISAMLQSQQAWLPVLSEPVSFKTFAEMSFGNEKYIAHCEKDKDRNELSHVAKGGGVICIGPEGDFSTAEISLAIEKGFIPVSLGETRLRTETAALVAAVLLSSK